VWLGDDTDWEEIGELVTESYRRLAPKKLTARLDQQRVRDPARAPDHRNRRKDQQRGDPRCRQR
jgi:hypothetical protein